MKSSFHEWLKDEKNKDQDLCQLSIFYHWPKFMTYFTKRLKKGKNFKDISCKIGHTMAPWSFIFLQFIGYFKQTWNLIFVTGYIKDVLLGKK